MSLCDLRLARALAVVALMLRAAFGIVELRALEDAKNAVNAVYTARGAQGRINGIDEDTAELCGLRAVSLVY